MVEIMFERLILAGLSATFLRYGMYFKKQKEKENETSILSNRTASIIFFGLSIITITLIFIKILNIRV